MKIILAVIYTIGILLGVSCSPSIAADLRLDSINMFGYFVGGKNITYYIDDRPLKVEEGKISRHQFHEFDNADGVNTEIIDVECIVKKLPDEINRRVGVRLSVAPKVARISCVGGFEGNECNTYEIEQPSVLLAPIILKDKKMHMSGSMTSQTIIFERINILKIINDYLKKGLVVTDLVFYVSIDPCGKDDLLGNNVMEKILKIPVPAY